MMVVLDEDETDAKDIGSCEHECVEGLYFFQEVFLGAMKIVDSHDRVEIKIILGNIFYTKEIVQSVDASLVVFVICWTADIIMI
jgi:hypothetical protein